MVPRRRADGALIDSQAVEAGATVVAALGALAAALYTRRAIEVNRKAARTRLTVDLFETAMAARLMQNINALLNSRPTLTNCRANLEMRLAMLTSLPQEEREQYLDLLGIMGYAGELYTQGALDKRLFLSRAADFIAVAFYLLEPAVADGLRSGLLRQSMLTLARECVAYRNRTPRTFDDKPELRTYTIPASFPD